MKQPNDELNRTEQLEKEIKDREDSLEPKSIHMGYWSYDDILKAELKGCKETAEKMIELLETKFWLEPITRHQLIDEIKRIGGFS